MTRPLDLPPPLLTEAVTVHLLPYVLEQYGVALPPLPRCPTMADLHATLTAAQGAAGRLAARHTPGAAELVDATSALLVAVEDGADTEGAGMAVASLVGALRARG